MRERLSYGSLRMAQRHPGVFYRHTVEALLDQVMKARGLMTPALESELRTIGVDVGHPVDVDFETWLNLVKVCARSLEPLLLPDEALVQLGKSVIDGYTKTMLGQGALLLSKLAGPKRSLIKAAETWAIANTVYKVRTEEKGASRVEVHVNVGGEVAPYNRGVLLGALGKLSVRDGKVEQRDELDGVTYVITWST